MILSAAEEVMLTQLNHMFFIGLGRIDINQHARFVYFQMQNFMRMFLTTLTAP